MTPQVRLVATGLWILVAAGPVLGTAALLRPAAPVAADGPDHPPPAVAGVAELAVRAHLTAMPDEAPVALSPAHPALRPTGSATDGLSTDARQSAVTAAGAAIGGVATIGTEPAGPGRWGVTVGVLRAGRLEAWQVTVAAHDTGAVVESLPAPVGLPAAPAPPTPATSPLRAPEADDDMAVAIQRFLDALLGGEGELQRYVATDARIGRPDVTASTVELLRLATGAVGAHHLAVLAEVRVIRTDGAVHVSHYPLLVTRTDGRWEVQRLLPALPTRPVPPTPTDATPADTTTDTRRTR